MKTDGIERTFLVLLASVIIISWLVVPSIFFSHFNIFGRGPLAPHASEPPREAIKLTGFCKKTFKIKYLNNFIVAGRDLVSLGEGEFLNLVVGE